MDHKLKVFKEVALTKSFSRAAENLFISQPAVSKIIKNLEEEYGKAFFLRQGNHIELTSAGELFLSYTEKLLRLYEELSDEVSDRNIKFPQELKLGASTTIAHYIIPKLAAQLQTKIPGLKFNLSTGNTEEIQRLILTGQLNFGIVEGENHNTRLHYEKFVKDELVLVTNAKNKMAIGNSISLDQLKSLSFIERESGSGTRQVIDSALKKQKINARSIHSIFGSTESIKSYLRYANQYAFLSVHAIGQELLENRLRLIEIDDFRIERWFYFVARQGFYSHTNQKIKNHFLKSYNQKE